MNSPHFTETESSLPCSQQSTAGSYPEPDVSNPHLPTLFPIVVFPPCYMYWLHLHATRSSRYTLWK